MLSLDKIQKLSAIIGAVPADGVILPKYLLPGSAIRHTYALQKQLCFDSHHPFIYFFQSLFFNQRTNQPLIFYTKVF